MCLAKLETRHRAAAHSFKNTPSRGRRSFLSLKEALSPSSQGRLLALPNLHGLDGGVDTEQSEVEALQQCELFLVLEYQLANEMRLVPIAGQCSEAIIDWIVR